MALARRGTQRIATSIWPGFVDAMTALILVLFFVLSIFMIVQFVLRDVITGQDQELDSLSREVAGLADALGLARDETARQEELITTLTSNLAAAEGEIVDFEQRVAALVAQNRDLSGALDAAEEELAAGEEAARLAAARRAALEALVASLRSETEEASAALAETRAALGETEEALTDAEAARVAEAAAAEMLRDRLESSQTELTALTLSLEEERRRAEETLTLLAAERAAREALEGAEAEALSEAERQRGLLAAARAALAEEETISTEAQERVALLNQQTAELRRQLDALQGLLNASREREDEAEVQIETLGRDLNAALARVAVEERARAELEARERARLEAEAQDLERYRSEFFGRMREILGEREGVQVVGDRFVFQSEVLFQPGSAVLGPDGRAQIARVASVIRDVSDEIPSEIDWILRVDGHTDRIPVSAGSPYADNWELSQARALSVVRYMIEAEGLPPNRLAATGFGEYQPIDDGFGTDALARNRRIELKLTER